MLKPDTDHDTLNAMLLEANLDGMERAAMICDERDDWRWWHEQGEAGNVGMSDAAYGAGKCAAAIRTEAAKLRSGQ